MARNTVCTAKGVGAGLLLGAALGAVGGWMVGCGSKRTVKKRVRSISSSVGDLIDNMGYMFK